MALTRGSRDRHGYAAGSTPEPNHLARCLATVATVVPALWLWLFLAFRGTTFIHGPDAVDDTLLVTFASSNAIGRWGVLSAMYLPDILAGFSNWANPHFHVLYPLYFNWLGSDVDLVDAWARMDLVVELHLAIYGAGVCLLALTLGARRSTALIAGMAAPWFPAAMSAASWPQIIASLAWLPWVMACQVGLLAASSRRQRGAWTAGSVACAALLVYAQPAQNLVLTVAGSALFWICLLVMGIRDPLLRRQAGRALAYLVAAAVLVLLLTGGYLHGLYQFHATSIRWLGEVGGEIHGRQPVPLAALVFHGLDPKDATSLLHYQQGATKGGIGNPYIGPGILVACALLCLGTRGAPRALALVAVLAITACFKVSAPVLHRVPVANMVREIVWWSCLASPLLTALAAVAIDRLPQVIRAHRPRRWRVQATAATLLAAILLVAGGGGMSPISTLCGIAALGALLLSFIVPDDRGNARRARILAAVVFFWASAYVPASSTHPAEIGSSSLSQPPRAGFWSDARRIAEVIPDATERYRTIVDSQQFHDYQVFSKFLAAAGIRTTRAGSSPMSYDKFRLLHFPNPATLRLFGVRYTVVSSEHALDGDIPISERISVRLTGPDALPRLFVAKGGVRAVDSPVDALLTQSDGNIYFYVSHQDAERLHVAQGTQPARILHPNLIEANDVRLSGRVSGGEGGLLVLNEDPSARWRARINGKPVHGLRVNAFQTGFPAPAGPFSFEIDRPGGLPEYRATAFPAQAPWAGD